MHDDFDSQVNVEECNPADFGHTDNCTVCGATDENSCMCDDLMELPPNLCVHCGLAWGRCDCQSDDRRDREWDENPQYDRMMYEESDLHHEC
jgi:hypothetical protein